MPKSRLTIVIVNYRTARLTVDCLRSLAAERARMLAVEGAGGEVGGDWRVVVADNASGDDSVEVIGRAIVEAGWGGWCQVVPLPRNGGFAYGNNAGVAAGEGGGGRYILLLNPDTVVLPGAVEALVRHAEAHPELGILGSRLEDPDGTPQCSAFRFPGILSEFEAAARLGVVTRLLRRWQIAPPVRDEPHRCDWVAGACMLVRREVWEKLGGMDERYFMYFEEVDFCRRASRAGWGCGYVPQARVVHLVGQSSGVTDTKRPPKRLPAYWFESRRWYLCKHHGRVYAAAADLAWVLGHLVYLMHTTLRRKPRRDPPYLLRDFLAHALGRRAAS